MARPYPVVGVAAELAHIIGRIGHQPEVLEGLFVEHVEAVRSEEGHDAHLHPLLFLQVALLQQFLGQRLQEALALCGIDVSPLLLGFGVHLFRHVHDAEHEGKRQARCAEFFGTAVGEVAVLHVVVADAAHFVHIAEAAVVVGQHQSVGADHLAGTSAAEDADALAQAGRGFTVKSFGGQSQPGFAQRVGQVLLLHEFQQPHAFIGLCAGQAQCQGQTNSK